MTTIKINERTKAGKAILALAKILSESNKGVTIENGLSGDAKNLYDPRFVSMVKKGYKSAKKGNVTVLDPKNIWPSLGLK